MHNHKKVVIVGAGMAGLTAAAYLTRENYDVLLLEKNDRSGGLLGTFETKGFFFDSGPRAFVNSGIVKPMLKDLGIDWQFLENIISVGIEDELFRINSMADLSAYEQALINLYPENQAEIKTIMTHITQLSEYTRVLYEFDNPNFVDLMSDKKFIFRKLIPWTFKFLHALRKFNQFSLPMEDFMKRLTQNQSLIDIILQHFFRKTPTYFALGYFYVYLDYFYPKGGTGALEKLLREKVVERGGKIQLNTHVVEINPSQANVVDSEGRDYVYDHLIWAADLKTLYRSLIATGLELNIQSKILTQAECVNNAWGAESVFILFAGVNRPPSYFQKNGGEHMFFTPSKQGLGQINDYLRKDLLDHFEQKSKQEIFDWVADYCKLNTYEVSIPVLRDPSLAPEGQTGIMISLLFDYHLMKKIEDAGWYEELKEYLEETVIELFSQSIYQGLNEDILFKFSSTPLTIEKVSGSSEGAIVGWSFETQSPVINKLQDIPKSVLTPIPNVYQAGQWSYSPAGVPIAMLTGWYAEQEILKQSKKNKK